MDYCTIEQCHAIVNAAIAQLKLDLAQAQMDSGGSASTLSMALAGGEITGASLLASVGGAPTDAGGDAGEVRARPFEARIEASRLDGARPPAPGTARVPAALCVSGRPYLLTY